MKTTLSLSMAIALVAGSITPALADDQAKIDATLSRLASSCKTAVTTKIHGVSMADVRVEVAASVQESLDSGAMGLSDLQRSGASYNWEVPSKKASGYCDVDAQGKVTQFSGQ